MSGLPGVASMLPAVALAVSTLLAVDGVRSAAAPSLTPRAGLLLVASESMADPRFARTVLLLLEADADGAVALTLNRPLQVNLQQVLPDLPARAREVPVYAGGPVQRGQVAVLVRSVHEAPGMVPVLDGVMATLSLSALQALMHGIPEVETVRAYLGYAGWAPGQLQGELARGDWHLVETSAAEVFETPPGQMWQRLQRRAAGVWVLRSQPPSRSTSTPSTTPSASASTRTCIG